MSCSKCFEKFTLFKKEIGCTSCGYSICSKCSKKNNKNVVCITCFDKISNVKPNNESKQQLDDSLPENFLKMRRQNEAKLTQNKTRTVDDELLEKLNKLKESKNKDDKIVNDDEIQSRLNNLMQINPNTSKLSNLPTKSVVNTADDLIKQMTEEASLDQKLDEYNKNELNDLEIRVKKLLEPYPGQSNASSVLTNESQSEEAKLKPSKKPKSKSKELMKQLLSEAESNYKRDNKKKSDDDMDNWCAICNDDGDFKCIDCDNDVYCKRCFKECHDKYEYKTHRRKDL